MPWGQPAVNQAGAGGVCGSIYDTTGSSTSCAVCERVMGWSAYLQLLEVLMAHEAEGTLLALQDSSLCRLHMSHRRLIVRDVRAGRQAARPGWQ